MIFKRHIEYGKQVPKTPFQRVAHLIWAAPKDPTLYILLEVDATELLAVKQAYQDALVPTTTVALLIRLIAMAFAQQPFALLRERNGRLYEPTCLRMGVLASSASQSAALGLVTLDDPHLQSPKDIAEKISARSRTTKTTGSKWQLPERLSDLLMRAVLKITQDYNLALPAVRPVDPYGSVLISSVEQFPAEAVFPPLHPVLRAPALVTLGRIQKKPVVKNDQVVVGQRLTITYSVDHRFVTGRQCSQVGEAIIEYIENAKKYVPLPKAPESSDRRSEAS